jgi:hypothetical protein
VIQNCAARRNTQCLATETKTVAITKQWLHKHISVAMNTCATMEELLENRNNAIEFWLFIFHQSTQHSKNNLNIFIIL